MLKTAGDGSRAAASATCMGDRDGIPSSWPQARGVWGGISGWKTFPCLSLSLPLPFYLPLCVWVSLSDRGNKGIENIFKYKYFLSSSSLPGLISHCICFLWLLNQITTKFLALNKNGSSPSFTSFTSLKAGCQQGPSFPHGLHRAALLHLACWLLVSEACGCTSLFFASVFTPRGGPLSNVFAPAASVLHLGSYLWLYVNHF